MYGNFNVERVNALEMQMRNDAIAINSLDCSAGDLIKINGSGFGALATAGDRIDGVSITNKVFSGTNQTVGFERINMIPVVLGQGSWKAPIYEGTITEANIGNFFDITSTQEVDYGTASTSTGVVKLIRVLSTTVGEFVFTGQGT